MKLFKLIIFGLFFTSSISVDGQEKNDTQLLEDLASSISSGVNTKDHEKILNAFIHPTALIYSTYKGLSKGGYSIESNTAQGLSDFIKNSKEKVNQSFDFVKVKKISNGRAIVTTHYKVTIGDKKSHQGNEYYSAVKTLNGWKFISLMFTLESWSD